MKPLFEIFDAENEKLLTSQEIKKNLHKIDAEDASVVVQLTSGDAKGNVFRALRPGDTELIVGVYSVNAKGNIAVLTGLGKEPVAVISTIFDIVKRCVSANKTIETITFRLNKRALKGKEKLLQRIIQKLVKARFGSRFEIKDEFIDVSPTMSFIVAQKRSAEELDLDDFVEKHEKVKDTTIVKELDVDFTKSDTDIKILKKYGKPVQIGPNIFKLIVPKMPRRTKITVNLNPEDEIKIIATNVDKDQGDEIKYSGLERAVSLKRLETGLVDVYCKQFDEYTLSTIIHYTKGGKTYYSDIEPDYDHRKQVALDNKYKRDKIYVADEYETDLWPD